VLKFPWKVATEWEANGVKEALKEETTVIIAPLSRKNAFRKNMVEVLKQRGILLVGEEDEDEKGLGTVISIPAGIADPTDAEGYMTMLQFTGADDMNKFLELQRASSRSSDIFDAFNASVFAFGGRTGRNKQGQAKEELEKSQRFRQLLRAARATLSAAAQIVPPSSATADPSTSGAGTVEERAASPQEGV
jgi:hypothetical protein